ncbi:Hypothetical protein GLP15_2289 [Giardia lamblia P15]|uniref:Uncharacterized protein n=1 Tax=Giardia intestinalis (strain P15) TaxID=658858 RepID=E1F2X0_GIAIA|nr:Hypothetical protein GLP15_2289 [Giardia lamblia P15]
MTDGIPQLAISNWLSGQGSEHVLTFFLFNDAWGLARDLCTALFSNIDSSLTDTFVYQNQFLNCATTTIGNHCVTIRFVSFLSPQEAQLHSSTLRALEEESTSCILLTVINCSTYAASCTEAYAIEQVIISLFQGGHNNQSINIQNLLLKLMNDQATKAYSGAMRFDQPLSTVTHSRAWPLFHLLINPNGIPLLPQNMDSTAPPYAALIPLYYLSSFYPSTVISLQKDQSTKSADSATRLSQATQATQASTSHDQQANLSETLFLLASKTNDFLSNFKDLTSQLSKVSCHQCSPITIFVMYSILLSFGGKLAHPISESNLLDDLRGFIALLFSLASFRMTTFLLPAGWNTLLAVEYAICNLFSYKGLPEGMLPTTQFYSLIAQPSIKDWQPTSSSEHVLTPPPHSAMLNPVAIEHLKRTELSALLSPVTHYSQSDPSYSTNTATDVGESVHRRHDSRQESAPISSTFALSTVVTSVVDEPLDVPDCSIQKEIGRRGKSIVLVEESDAGLHELQQGSLATPELYQGVSSSRMDNAK